MKISQTKQKAGVPLDAGTEFMHSMEGIFSLSSDIHSIS